jgi:hypothetical protein
MNLLIGSTNGSVWKSTALYELVVRLEISERSLQSSATTKRQAFFATRRDADALHVDAVESCHPFSLSSPNKRKEVR